MEPVDFSNTGVKTDIRSVQTKAKIKRHEYQKPIGTSSHRKVRLKSYVMSTIKGNLKFFKWNSKYRIVYCFHEIVYSHTKRYAAGIFEFREAPDVFFLRGNKNLPPNKCLLDL